MVAKPKAAPMSGPGAWIVTNNRKDKSQPSDRGRKSLKNNKVYLDDGEEFEIELHNSLQDSVLCDIKLNGQSISKSGLVLRPGQRFYLDCFIDDKKKFIFNTYEVEDTQESSDAISKNGLLEVYFYKEDVIQINDWTRKFDRVIIERYPIYYPVYPYYHHYYPYTHPNIYYGSINYTGSLSTTTNTNTSGIIGNSTYADGSGTLSTTTNTNTSSGITGNSTYTSGSSYYNNIDLSGMIDRLSNHTTPINNIETGRVEKGSSSSQKFDEIDMQFQSMYIAHTILQILPNSRKPIEVEDIVKSKFCSECGSKTKDHFKFCPSCGNNLK